MKRARIFVRFQLISKARVNNDKTAQQQQQKKKFPSDFFFYVFFFIWSRLYTRLILDPFSVCLIKGNYCDK